VHGANSPLSSAHSTRVPGWSAVKLKLAPRASVVGSGAEPIVTVAGMSPISQPYTAGDGSVPVTSEARTANSCSPFARPVYALGDSQAENVPSSSRHSNVAPERSEENSNVAEVLSVGSSGVSSIEVSGVATVHSWRAGVPSRLPASSIARTSKLCSPAICPA
jgi:hypothetical protein